MTESRYRATIVSHAISETKAGDPQAVITLSYDSDGPKSITWYGSFKEKALPHTLKALLVCGLQGNNPSGALEIGKEVYITIGDEAGSDGKMRTKVKWINPVGGFRKVMPQDLAKSKLSALEGAVMSARASLNINEEIPF